MLVHSRRRMLGLFAAAAGVQILTPLSALARIASKNTNINKAKQPKPAPAAPGTANPANPAAQGGPGAQKAPAKPDCYASKTFGQWTAQATNTSAGAKISALDLNDKCSLLNASFQVSDTLDAKLVLFGDPDSTHLTKPFLIQTGNRVVAKDADGEILQEARLCGVCTGISNDKVAIVLPLAFSALLRTQNILNIEVKLAKMESCGFTLHLQPMRQALQWAIAQHQVLAAKAQADQCRAPQKCFITTACCDLLGLPDDCFELRSLRRYRDEVLLTQPGGAALVARYYRVAPLILARLTGPARTRSLLSVYWRFVLPSALAARCGLNRLAYRLYTGMMGRLLRDLRTKA